MEWNAGTSLSPSQQLRKRGAQVNDNLSNDEYHRGMCKYCTDSKEGDTGKDTHPREVRAAVFPILS